MIPEVAPYNNYTGDGSTTKFDFDFYIEDSTQLVVQLTQEDGTIKTLTNDTDYTIHEVGNKNGSYITFPITGSSYSTLSSSEIISLSLSLPIAQESEYGTSSELDLVSLEYSLDYLTRICQIMNRQVTRALKVAEGSNINTDELALDVEKIADISNDVSTVAEIAADVTAVKNNATNITTVAGSIANVNAVGENIENVNTIAADLTNIDTVAGSISNVNTVGNNISSVNAVAGSISNVNTIKEDLTNIDNVADDLVNINAVAGSISNVDTVAAISSDVTAVKNNATNINAVAADLTNINAVAADLTNIDAASSNAQLAKDWANKMNGTVDGYEYSAKYYAQQAAQGQVQANWNESDASSKAYIWNKPTIPDAQIQADWNQADNTKKDFIKNKPDLTTKQDTLVSGTNIKTINNNSILGSGDLTLDGLPSQTGNEGKFLTTDGTNASWAAVQAGANQNINNLTSLGNARLQYAPFAINDGTVLNSENNTLTYSGSTLTCDPCTITTADGRTKIFDTASSIDVSSQVDGSYSIFKDYETGELSLVDELVISKTEPSAIYWLDTSTIPANLKVNGVINNDLVYIGDCTIANGVITALENRYLNACPYYRDLVDSYQNGSSWYAVYSDGWCEQGGHSTNQSNTIITFLKPFADTKYTITFGIESTSSNAIDYNAIAFTSRTATTITKQSNAKTAEWSWLACGYIF